MKSNGWKRIAALAMCLLMLVAFIPMKSVEAAGSSTATVHNWAQGSAQWKSIYSKLSWSSACAVVAIAIQIARTDLVRVDTTATTYDMNTRQGFNPATFAKAAVSKNVIATSAKIKNWKNVNKVVPGFEYAKKDYKPNPDANWKYKSKVFSYYPAKSEAQICEAMMWYRANGYYPIIEGPGSKTTHYVAVISATANDVTVVDPADGRTKSLFSISKTKGKWTAKNLEKYGSPSGYGCCMLYRVNSTYLLHNGPVSSIVTFNANGGSVSTSSKSVTSGQSYGTLPVPSYSGYDFVGWFDAPSGGNPITSSTIVTKTSNHTLYAHWTGHKYTVYFDAKGGNCTTGSKTVTFADTYGALPTPTWDGYECLGWYTAATGGTKVTSSTKVTTASNHTLHAHWKWVLKYSYDPNVAMSKAYSLLQTAESKGHKCATYASSVLRAGGLTNVKKSGAGDLIDYLNKPSNFGASIGKVITNPTASQLHKGDVLCVVCTKGAKADFSNGHSKGAGKYYGLHVLIVSEVNASANTVKYYAANNYVYGNQTLNLSTYKVKCSKCGNSNSAKLIAFVFNDAVKSK